MEEDAYVPRLDELIPDAAGYRSANVLIRKHGQGTALETPA